MNKSVLSTCLAIFVAVLAPAGDLKATESIDQVWRFQVKLGDKDIGQHQFTVKDFGDRKIVEIDAEFNVKVLFINAYQYDHATTEVWQANCMQQIDAETDDNGDFSRVEGERSGNAFIVNTNNGGAVELDTECINSFAYWNPEILTADRLLNSQTGEWVDVSVEPLGKDELMIQGEKVAANRYRINMADGPISLWYEPESYLWLALEAQARNGRTVSYHAIELPSTPTGEQRLVSR